MSEFERKPDGGLSAWIETYEAMGAGENDAEMLCLLLELRRRRGDEPELKGKLEAAERERDELRAEQAEHDEQIARMDGKFNLAKRALDSKTERCDKAEAELARRDAAAGEPVAWHFYDDGSWHNGSNHNNHREDTEKAGYRIRELFPAAPPAVVSDSSVGEPDGYIFCHPSGKNFWSVSHRDTAGHNGVKPFYFAAPPAVLPPEKEVPPFLTHQAGKAIGWNDCIAEALKLGAQPQKPVVLPFLSVAIKSVFEIDAYRADDVLAALDAANVPYEVKP